jgi:hypothetical protein
MTRTQQLWLRGGAIALAVLAAGAAFAAYFRPDMLVDFYNVLLSLCY